MMNTLLLTGIVGVLFLSGCRSTLNEDASPFPPVSPSRIDHLWDDPTKAGVEELFAASHAAAESGDLERAVFFLWCGQVRLRYEASIFPPKGTGGNSPILAFSSIAHSMGMGAVPMLFASPKSHRRVVDQFQDYVPALTRSYRPFWDYESRVDDPEIQHLAKEMVAGMVAHSQRVMELTAIPEYLESLKIYVDVVDYSQEQGERFRAANAIMFRIEEETGFESGLAYKPRESSFTNRLDRSSPRDIEHKAQPGLFDLSPPSDTEPDAQPDDAENGGKPLGDERTP